MSVHINALEIENVKRVRTVSLTPSPTGLTVIGGRNNQGKTSVLDAIAWALGGDRFRPDNPAREGANTVPHLRVVLSNGIVVERRGKNSALTVTDPGGRRGGQQLLNSFVEELALNLPKFMGASDKEKAETLLRIIGVGDQLHVLEAREAELYQQRLLVGQMAQRKKYHADELPEIPGAPAEEVSASELIRRQQTILQRNAENQRKRANVERYRREAKDLTEQIAILQDQLEATKSDLETALRDAADLVDESTAELEADLQRIDEINRAVRTNAAKRAAQAEAQSLGEQYQQLTGDIERTRTERRRLLEGAALPLPGLSVEQGKLLYQGQPWGNLSGSDQLRVATAIVRCLKPECGFVLLDKLEQMDEDTMASFGAWLEAEGLQAIATRVSSGGECSIIIEDGLVQEPQTAPAWQKGIF